MDFFTGVKNASNLGIGVFTSLMKPPDQQFKGQLRTATAQSCQTRTSWPVHFKPTQGHAKNVTLIDAGCIWWAHWSHDLFPLHNSAPNRGGPCLSDSGFEGHRVTETPGNYTSNSKVLNKGFQANLGCVQLVGTNIEHFPFCLYSCSWRGTKLAWTKSLLPSQAKTDLNPTSTRPDNPMLTWDPLFIPFFKFT